MEDAAFVPGAGDLAFEEELLREPYALGGWLRYLAHSAEAGPRRRQVLYERALRALPGSYKLWRAYLAERRAAAAGLPCARRGRPGGSYWSGRPRRPPSRGEQRGLPRARTCDPRH